VKGGVQSISENTKENIDLTLNKFKDHVQSISKNANHTIESIKSNFIPIPETAYQYFFYKTQGANRKLAVFFRYLFLSEITDSLHAPVRLLKKSLKKLGLPSFHRELDFIAETLRSLSEKLQDGNPFDQIKDTIQP